MYRQNHTQPPPQILPRCSQKIPTKKIDLPRTESHGSLTRRIDCAYICTTTNTSGFRSSGTMLCVSQAGWETTQRFIHLHSRPRGTTAQRFHDTMVAYHRDWGSVTSAPLMPEPPLLASLANLQAAGSASGGVHAALHFGSSTLISALRLFQPPLVILMTQPRIQASKGVSKSYQDESHQQ